MLPLVLTLCFPLLLFAGYGVVFVLTGRSRRLLVGPVGFFLYLALLAIPFTAVLTAHPDLPARALAWDRYTPAWLTAGVLSGLALWWLQFVLPGRTPETGERVWTGSPGWLGFCLLMLPVACIVFAEELVWRGFLLPEIGWLLSSAAFALHHYHFGLRHVLFSFLAGFAWGGLYLLAGTLWPPVVSHLVYNAFAWRHMRRAHGVDTPRP